MKRYIIYAKRKDETQWSVWTDTNDIAQIEVHVNRIRELGYEAKVTDPAIEYFEKNIEKGYILKTPVAIGQTVYAIVEDGEPYISEWIVKAIHYDGNVWYAIDGTGNPYVVGDRGCIPIKLRAKKLLNELKGEGE